MFQPGGEYFKSLNQFLYKKKTNKTSVRFSQETKETIPNAKIPRENSDHRE